MSSDSRKRAVCFITGRILEGAEIGTSEDRGGGEKSACLRGIRSAVQQAENHPIRVEKPGGRKRKSGRRLPEGERAT